MASHRMKQSLLYRMGTTGVSVRKPSFVKMLCATLEYDMNIIVNDDQQDATIFVYLFIYS